MVNTILILLAVSAVAVADVFLKKAAGIGSMAKAMTSPWMLAAIGLYLFQIFFFTYLFISGAKLSYVGVMQTVLYAVIVLSGGIFIFSETISTFQAVGMLLAIIGALMINL